MKPKFNIYIIKRKVVTGSFLLPGNFCAQASCFERVTFPKRKRNESRISISQAKRPFLKPKSNIYIIKRKVVTGSFALPAQNRKIRFFLNVFL